LLPIWITGRKSIFIVLSPQSAIPGKTFLLFNIATGPGVLNSDPAGLALTDRFVQTNAASDKHYYRILETDLSGAAIYSSIAIATIAAGNFSIAVLNNPAPGQSDPQLQISAANAGATTVELPMSNWPAGSYIVKVMLGNATQTTQVVKR
jgi:hypothetical protein